MKSYSAHLSAKSTPQSEALFGKSQVKNSAGGYVFATNKWTQLDRFLILGTSGGSYYASERKLTIQNAQVVLDCIAVDGPRTVARIAEISDAGRAQKNDVAIFALAICATKGDAATRQAVYANLSKVCRIGTHLFQFTQECTALGKGWGRGMKRAISKWYLDKTADNLGNQLVKYQSRVTSEGSKSSKWSHRDVLRLAHPKSDDATVNAALRWSVKGFEDEYSMFLPKPIKGFEMAKKATTVAEIVRLIEDYNLPREAIPTNFLNDVEVWAALLVKMPLNALVRNLGKMSNVGLLKVGSAGTKLVLDKLADGEYIRKSRLHPMTIFVAMKQYSIGHGLKGDLSWSPVPAIVSALDKAFYKAFENVEATGLNYYLGVDVSGSMMSPISGTPLVSCKEAAAIMAMTLVKKEPSCHSYGFTSTGGSWSSGAVMKDLGFHDSMSLGEVVKITQSLPFGGTDCSLPMIHALQNNIFVDVFVVLTDSETWAGRVHPTEALRQYREKVNPKAKLVVVGMVANNFTIADPSDAGQLDVVGFDTNTPAAIAEFAKM